MRKSLCFKFSLGSESPKNLAGRFRLGAKAQKIVQEVFAWKRKLKKCCGEFSLGSESLKNAA